MKSRVEIDEGINNMELKWILTYNNKHIICVDPDPQQNTAFGLCLEKHSSTTAHRIRMMLRDNRHGMLIKLGLLRQLL